jgi:hypothetical protein
MLILPRFRAKGVVPEAKRVAASMRNGSAF